jgi:hypothetical protein
MEHNPVSSSNLSSVGYDPSGVLEIQFRNRTIYQYFDVPNSIYEGLMNAGSTGKFFHIFIRSAFPFRRIQ